MGTMTNPAIIPGKPRILLVDDKPENLLVLAALLKGKHKVDTVTSGEEALTSVTESPPPDLILLDIMMPGMDGFEVCRRLKADAATRDIPVIFITALDEPEHETKGFSVGAVDFVSKPINASVVRARVDTHIALSAARKRISQQNERLTYERELVEAILLGMREEQAFVNGNIRTLLTPVERTNGDLLLLHERHDGTLNILVGDFTGHGLPAAVGGPLAVDAFHAMSHKGFDLKDILPEINGKLKRKMPTHLYLAACGLQINPTLGHLRLFNGGMPDILIRRQGGDWEHFPSTHAPLGIRQEVVTSTLETAHTLRPGDRIYAYSDGIIETRNAKGELFGIARLREALEGIVTERSELAILTERLDRFRGDGPQHDDITLVEVTCP